MMAAPTSAYAYFMAVMILTLAFFMMTVSFSQKMKELTWTLYNQLQDDAMAENSEHERFFNFKLFKENKVVKVSRKQKQNELF